MLRSDTDLTVPSRAAIRLNGVARRFGQRWVLRGLDLTVQRGEVVVLTGRNGSGKTTLLRIVATLLRPTRGTAVVFGHDTVREGERIRGHVGMLGHNSSLYDDLTAAENLVFSTRMAGLPADRVAIELALAQVGLAAERSERVRGFSAGMRRRLGLARLLLRPPQVLLLDEPYSSFDEDGIGVVNEFVREVSARGGVVLLSTHDIGRAEDVVTRRVHITDGRLGDVATTAPAAPAAHRVGAVS